MRIMGGYPVLWEGAGSRDLTGPRAGGLVFLDGSGIAGGARSLTGGVEADNADEGLW